MKKLHRSLLQVLGVLATLFVVGRAGAAPFTAGNIAVVRVGDGATALSANATATFIDEYTPAGVFVQSIPIPSTAAALARLTLSGSATSEGALTRSPNGALLCFAGYQAPAGTVGVATATAGVIGREIGTVDVAGTFAVGATTGTQFSGSNIRSGATDGASNFWGGGTSTPAGTGGVNYLGTASLPAQLLSGNLRWVNIFNGNLYFSSGSAAPGTGIHQFTGLPVAAAASTPVTTLAGQSPYGFSIDPTGNMMYVADDRATTSGGGIQRWNKAGVVWTLAYTLGTGGGSTAGTRGLVVNWSGTAPMVFATTTEAANNRLIAVADTGVGSVPATIATPGGNRAFRGVAFAPAVTRVPKPHFFTSNNLPPGNGVYVSPADFHAAYANGNIIKNVSHNRFTQGLPPPPAGGTQVHTFGSTVQMDVSTDNGLSFQHVSAPASVRARVSHASDDPLTNTRFYDTEMEVLNISGGSLPATVMVRESPSKASLGKTSIQTIPGGFMIDSFFDIFTEISLDGGQSWLPAQVAAHVDLNVDPTLITPIPAPTTLLPPPNDLYISPAQFHVLFAQGIVIRDVKHRFFTGSLPPPPLGQTQTHTFDSQVDMEVSIDGGQTFRPTRAPAAVTVRLAHTRDEGGTQIFDTEMLQLDIQGGDLLPGVMLRESPTKQSTGGTAITPNSDGTHRIGSFFDIFTELSLDGGQNWSPAVSAPAHVELICNAPEVVEPTPNLPPKDDQYVSPEDFHVAFAAGIIIKDISHDRFTQSQPPPPPGASQIHSFQSQVKFRISQDGGATFNPGVAPAFAVVQVSSSVDAGSTRFYDTEMLSLEITGGSLPAGVMLRESPSKASLGRTSIRMVTDSSGVIWDYISSFFDIFVELTLDGGANWQPSVSGPAEVVLAKSPKPHFFTTNVLPPGNGVYVSPADFHAAYANGIIIKNVSHNRFTQGLPPPPPGGTQVHNFGSTVHMDVSNDGGATFAHVSAPASVSARVSGVFADPTGASFYDTEMLALNISGGGLPPNVMVRESPSKASLGRTSIEPVGGGFMIDSFFDIFTEISLDGGQNWSPSAEPGHVELAVDPTLIPPIPAPTTLLPPPNDLYVSPALYHVLFAQGIVIRDVKHRFFTGSVPGASGSLPAPPLVGQSQVHTFGSQVDMEVSNDGGQTFLPARAPAAVTVRVTHTRDEGPTQIFDTEMLQLDIQGGDLPLGVMLRESPSKQSLGGTAITPLADGTNRIGSFFDIFVELSLDGGQNWSPASSPAHVELQCNAPEVTEASPNLPPLGEEYVSPADFHAAYANGIVIKNVIHDRFTQSTPPPPPGGSQTHQFNSRVRFMISQNNGQTFSPGLAFADVRVRVSSSQDQGGTRFFDTEMLQLNIHGGNLPTTVMLRESPTKASLGRTSIRMVADPQGVIWDYISSFFDIFTELSLDGGQNWSPSISGPVEVVLHDADSDADGLPDDWERLYFGDLTHGPDEDADGDGDTNLEELLAGTDPTDPTSVLRPRFAEGATGLQLSFRSLLGHKYRVEAKINLESPSEWIPITPTIEGDDSLKTITINPAIDGPKHFYRVAVELSP